jgi:hypothetical protein
MARSSNRPPHPASSFAFDRATASPAMAKTKRLIIARRGSIESIWVRCIV